MNENEVMGEIDEALGELTEGERELVVCRYVGERDYAEMGRRFGVSGEAVRKKVGRAVEKLRVVLERRGVGVSASGLAVMLVGLSGSRASAALVAQVSGVAVKKGVVVGGGMFSMAGILAGAMGVSVVMGGVRMMEGKEEVERVPVAESERTTGSRGGSVFKQIRNGGASGRVLTDVEIWANLDALDGEPMTMVTELLLEEVLKSIPAVRVLEFIDEADERVSVKMKERLCFALMERAVEGNPGEAVESLLERGLFRMKNPDFRSSTELGYQGVMLWAGIELTAASEWVVKNWERLEGLGEARSITPAMYSKRRRENRGLGEVQERARTFADQIGQGIGNQHFRSKGFGGVKNFVENFDEETAVMIWKPIFFYARSVSGSELYPVEFTEYLVTFPDREPYGELKEVSWMQWYGSWERQFKNGGGKVTKREYLEALPAHLAADFEKSCLDDIHRVGEGGGE